MSQHQNHLQLYPDFPSPPDAYTYSTVVSHDPYVLNLPQIQDNHTLLFNLEVLLAVLLLLALPLFVCLAYVYGKRMGRKENVSLPHKYFGSDALKRTLSEESTSDNSQARLEDQNCKISSTESSPALVASSSQTGMNEPEQCLSPLLLDNNRRESSMQTDEEFTLSSEPRPTGTSTDNIVALGYKGDEKSTSEDFKMMYVQTWDPSTDQKGLDKDLFEEKLTLHGEEEHVLKKEVKYGVVFHKNGSHFQKTEIRELCTTYDPRTDIPLLNAKLLEETYKSAPIHKKLFSTNKEQASDKNPKTGGLLALENSETYHHGEGKLMAQKSLPVKETTVSLERQISLPVEARSLQERGKSVQDSKMETVVEKYGLPDETGKFNKIFRDVEWIGEGSFGEVYKVVHRLDGKLYAVKKVKLKLGRFEELKKESKVFREVFAMTDLHHHNIVRYSTCWVEIEWDKENADPKDKCEEPDDLGDISEGELHEEEASEVESEPQNWSKSSNMDFEWDVSAKDKEESKKQEEKKKMVDKVREILRKKTTEPKLPGLKRKRSHLMLRSLSKSFIDEEFDNNSVNSSISKVESVAEVPGCKLYLYIQMEYCEGQSLKYFLENSDRKIVRHKALEMFRKLLEGVHAIHTRGILHRDLKPANIFLDGHEDVKIGDFGLALLDKVDEQTDGLTPKDLASRKVHSLRVGTPMYTSPEQESGGHYDQKTDIYSLGLIFYELLTTFETHHERYQHFARIRTKNALPAGFARDFPQESEIILRMTQTFPEDRPTADQLLAEVDRLLEKQRGGKSG